MPKDGLLLSGHERSKRDRCDPTDPICTQGGIEAENQIQSAPLAPAGLEATDKVRLSLRIAGDDAGDIEIALWGSVAPSSVATFVKLSRGTLISEAGDEPASYERSVALRVQRDQAVVLGGLKKQGGSTRINRGQTRPQRIPVAPPVNDDANALRHDAAGLLSVKRGGGSFEFSLTTRPSKALDKDGIVIGMVTRGMELLERLNTLPTNNYNGGPMATVQIVAISVL